MKEVIRISRYKVRITRVISPIIAPVIMLSTKRAGTCHVVHINPKINVDCHPVNRCCSWGNANPRQPISSIGPSVMVRNAPIINWGIVIWIDHNAPPPHRSVIIDARMFCIIIKRTTKILHFQLAFHEIIRCRYKFKPSLPWIINIEIITGYAGRPNYQVENIRMRKRTKGLDVIWNFWFKLFPAIYSTSFNCKPEWLKRVL